MPRPDTPLARRLCHWVLAAALAAPVLTGCGEEGAGTPGAAPAFGLGAGFVIGDLDLSYRRLIGAEALQLTLTVESPAGRLVRSYGFKTPYEESVRRIQPDLAMAVRNGKLILKLDAFTQTPRSGEYPFELWLINEAGTASNRVQSSVYIQ